MYRELRENPGYGSSFLIAYIVVRRAARPSRGRSPRGAGLESGDTFWAAQAVL